MEPSLFGMLAQDEQLLTRSAEHQLEHEVLVEPLLLARREVRVQPALVRVRQEAALLGNARETAGVEAEQDELVEVQPAGLLEVQDAQAAVRLFVAQRCAPEAQALLHQVGEGRWVRFLAQLPFGFAGIVPGLAHRFGQRRAFGDGGEGAPEPTGVLRSGGPAVGELTSSAEAQQRHAHRRVQHAREAQLRRHRTDARRVGGQTPGNDPDAGEWNAAGVPAERLAHGGFHLGPGAAGAACRHRRPRALAAVESTK